MCPTVARAAAGWVEGLGAPSPELLNEQIALYCDGLRAGWSRGEMHLPGAAALLVAFDRRCSLSPSYELQLLKVDPRHNSLYSPSPPALPSTLLPGAALLCEGG